MENTLKHAEKYYINNDESYFNKKDFWLNATNWLNRVPAVTFILAIISVIIFTTQNFNIKYKDNSMAKKVFIEEGASVPTMQSISTRGANVPNMQKVSSGDTVTNGANIPKMQPAQPTETSSSDKKEK